jgi:acyl carrier protein
MDTIHQIILIISKISGINKSEISLKDKFIDDLHFNATDIAEMFNKLEDKFHIEFTKEDELQINNVGDLILTVKKKLNIYKEDFDLTNYYAEYIRWVQSFM